MVGGAAVSASLGIVTVESLSASADDDRSWVLKLEGVGNIWLDSATGLPVIGLQHSWQSVETSVRSLISADGDGRALHVVLTVSDMVEPRPGDDCLTGLQALGNLEAEGGKDVGRIGRQVSIGLDGMVTFPGLHNAEDAVLGRIGVVGDEHLSGATTVDSRADQL